MMRIGIGYDIHRIMPGRALVLAGVPIAAPFGLLGHSDADVALHAVMDALLGAAGLDDIGHYFPPDDPRYHGASSLDLLSRVRDLLTEAGFRPVNVDVVIVAEQPRVGPHVSEMRARTARALGIDPAAVGIKATTNEQVGPEGRQEAISAHAVALVEAL